MSLATRAVIRTGLACLAALSAGSGHDMADRAYLAALKGEENGMTREQQIALIDQAIAIRPERAYYYDTRAGYRIDLRRFDLALADFDRSIALSDRPYARFMRGLARCEAGNPAGALADFDTAIVRQPAKARARGSRGAPAPARRAGRLRRVPGSVPVLAPPGLQPFPDVPRPAGERSAP